MKVSLKIQQEDKPQTPTSLLLRAKLPISAFNLPFLSSLSVSSSSLSSPTVSLRTLFPSSPSLKLSYTPSSPLTLSLTSSVPHFSLSAQFSLSPSNPYPSPTFSLLIKPRFGDFSLKKPISSQSNPNPDPQLGTDPMGFVPIERPGSWKDLNLDPTREKSLISGVSLLARTALPVTKQVSVRFRWGVNFPTDIRKNLPFLSVDKIGIERVYEAKEERESSEEKKSVPDFELLKEMCASFGRELDGLRRENREMRRCLDDMQFGEIRKHDRGYKASPSDVVSKKRVITALPVSDNLGEIEGWNKVKKKGIINKEPKSNFSGSNDLEGELQRAIQAASSSQ